MKKTLLFAIAAICMVAACKKSPVPTPEDESPVAVQFNTKTIEASVTKTKAPVTAWSGSEDLFIYGFEVQRNGDGKQFTLGSGRYNLESPFIDAVKAKSPSGSATAIDVYANSNSNPQEPFYYDINTSVVYDFYGYYLGTATTESAVKGGDAITYPVTIDGTQDLMWATCNKESDVEKGDKTGNPLVPVVQTHQAYGAWAARRGVQPTLNFEHALSQFTFQIKKGQGSYEGNLTVTKIQIIGSNKGNFTVVGNSLGYVAAEDTDETDSFILDGKSSGTNIVFTPQSGNDYLPVDGALMVAPNQETIKIKVSLSASQYSPNGGVIEYEFDLNAKQVKLEGNGANITKFAAGNSYVVKIIVYGPEQVDFEVSLADWVTGGEIEYDPDSNNNAPAE